MRHFSLFLSFLLSTSAFVAQGASKLNKDAQALAKHLAPSHPARSYKPGDTAALAKRMTAAMEVLEGSYRTNGPGPESLIAKAFEFREDVGRWESLVLTNTLLAAWREANAMGLFDEAGKYTATVSKGRGIGDRTLFELVVPGEAYPPASNQLANLRLVREDQRRGEGTDLTAREQASLEQLRKLIDEREDLEERRKWENRKADSLGRTAEDNAYLWEKEMEEAGEAAKEKLPNIRVAGKAKSSPSKMTGYVWKTACEVSNRSTIPTEVKIEIWQIGYTWKKRDHYVMSKTEQTLQLRRNEIRGLEVSSKSEGHYKKLADDYDGLDKNERKESKVYYRGYAIRVTHPKGLVTFSASDQNLEAYVDPSIEGKSIERLPVF